MACIFQFVYYAEPKLKTEKKSVHSPSDPIENAQIDTLVQRPHAVSLYNF